MTTEQRKRFTVISNDNFGTSHKQEVQEKHDSYQTNPLGEKLVKFVNEKDKKFSVTDLLKW